MGAAACGAASKTPAAAGVGREQDFPGWGMDGQRLHSREEGVPPECWCITKEDLLFLRMEIETAVKTGTIRPTDLDPFDPADNEVGPCMHTVVASYVKPLTAEAGNMSWALMRHPEGIKCDMFVTHCWAEGAYEFIDKVLASWPRRTEGAWCCIFANPQNLDISDMIKEPKESPFARALQQAPRMMVVPTVKASIYSRIWCIYEAFLAVELRKTVFTATTPIQRKLPYSLLAGATLSVTSLLIGYLTAGSIFGHLCKADLSKYTTGFPLLLACLSFVVARRPLLSAGVNIAGTATVMVMAGMFIRKAQLCHDGDFRFAWMPISCAYFFANEIDRLRANDARSQARSLSKGYAGVQGASASVEADRVRILGEIGDRSGEVDASIRVLIDSGMSTNGLREAARLKADLLAAADFRWGMLLLAMILYGLMVYLCNDLGLFWIIADIIVLVMLVAIYVLSERDHQAFIATLQVKLTLLGLAIAIIWTLDWALLHIRELRAEEDGMERVYSEMMSRACKGMEGLLLFTLFFAVLGRSRIARLPCLGPCLVEALGPGCRGLCPRRARKSCAACRRRCCGRRRPEEGGAEPASEPEKDDIESNAKAGDAAPDDVVASERCAV